LLAVAPHLPEAEGRLVYFTVSAGVLGLGLAISVLVMLVTGNWMVRHPMSRVVQQLSGALARDIERRKAAEKKAVEARLKAEGHLAFLKNLIDASNRVGIVATDAEGLIQLLNRGAEVSLGASPADALGKLTLDDLHARTSRPSLEDTSLHFVVQEGEELVMDSSGVEHVIAVNYSNIVDGDGNTNGRLMVFIDITERKRLELKLKQQEMQLIQSAKLAGLGEMATGVAHELNQPLNNIGLLASRISRRLDRAAPEAKFILERLEKVQEQVQRASKIIEQLRTFGRPAEMSVTSFPVRRPLDAVLDLLRQQLVDRRIHLEVDIPDELPNVRADEAQLEQVLINLLNNARDALGELDCSNRKPSIRIKAELETSSDDAVPKVCLHVEDNGPGMSEGVACRVFEPFFSTKDVGRGTGLGLSISYGLVQGFGGTLTVRSQPAEGTIFSMTLPVCEAISEESRT
jgi:histidine kinase